MAFTDPFFAPGEAAGLAGGDCACVPAAPHLLSHGTSCPLLVHLPPATTFLPPSVDSTPRARFFSNRHTISVGTSSRLPLTDISSDVNSTALSMMVTQSRVAGPLI